MARLCVAVAAALLAVAGGQLVEKCGVAQPSTIFFPSSAPVLRIKRGLVEAFQLPKMNKPLVVGGENVRQELGRWPWMVLLGEQVNGRRRWSCGGTLISSRTVLTAAHCVAGRQSSALTARLGEHDTSTTRDGQHTDVSVSQIITHPGYAKKQNDIALLTLSRPVPFSRRIQPVCLPAADADHTGSSADLAGWGYTEFNGEGTSVLQEVSLTVVNEQQCERTYQKLRAFNTDFPGGFQGTKLCANGADGASKDSCRGDSGGPLVYRTTVNPRRYQVIGVVSTGHGCGNPEYPGIYTKVSKYIPWIISNSN